MSFVQAHTSYASVVPGSSACTASIRIIKSALPKKSSEKVWNFKVIKTSCKFLKEGKVFKASNISLRSPKFNIKQDSVYSGDVILGSSMGPNGSVSWRLFKSPNLEEENFSFSF